MSKETINIIITTPHKRYDEIINQIFAIEKINVLQIKNSKELEFKKI
jgi:hypothetical protein